MNGLSWHLVEDGYLGIGKHCRKWIVFGHAKVVLPSQRAALNRIGKWILLNYFWTRQGRFLTYLMKIWSKQFMRIVWEFLEWGKYRLLHNLRQKLPHGHDTQAKMMRWRLVIATHHNLQGYDHLYWSWSARNKAGDQRYLLYDHFV